MDNSANSVFAEPLVALHFHMVVVFMYHQSHRAEGVTETHNRNNAKVTSGECTDFEIRIEFSD